MTLVTTQIRDTITENEQINTTILHCIVILGVSQNEEGREKEWLKPGKNALDFRQRTKYSLTKFGR